MHSVMNVLLFPKDDGGLFFPLSHRAVPRSCRSFIITLLELWP